MKDFTMRNFLKQWKAILPLAVIFTFVGLIVGLAYNSLQKQSYLVTYEILTINTPNTTLPEDLVSIANSTQTVGGRAMEKVGADDTCSYKATKTGNVVKITSTCESSMENAQKLAEAIVESYSEAVISVYNNENIEVKTIDRANGEEQISTLRRAVFICLPALAGLALSAFIAFIKLDHITSKNSK